MNKKLKIARQECFEHYTSAIRCLNTFDAISQNEAGSIYFKRIYDHCDHAVRSSFKQTLNTRNIDIIYGCIETIDLFSTIWSHTYNIYKETKIQ